MMGSPKEDLLEEFADACLALHEIRKVPAAIPGRVPKFVMDAIGKAENEVDRIAREITG